MKVRNIPILFFTLCLLGLYSSCKEEKVTFLSFRGKYNNDAVKSLRGADEELAEAFAEVKTPVDTFYKWVREDWDEDVEEVKAFFMMFLRVALYMKRVEENFQDALMQKVIPLSEVENYISNRYRGISGFVDYAGDVKNLNIPKEWGENGKHGELFYEGSPFWEAPRSGVAVIRFRSWDGFPCIGKSSFKLTKEEYGIDYTIDSIPYMYPYPYTGIGFTRQGIPQYYAKSCNEIYDGEIYQITPSGRDVLLATYTPIGWKAYEGKYETKASCDELRYDTEIRNGLFLKKGDQYWHLFLGENEKIWVVSTQADDGFSLDADLNIYLREIDVSHGITESEGVVDCKTFVVKDGDTLKVEAKNLDGSYILTTNDPQLAQKYYMQSCDFGTYRRTITQKEWRDKGGTEKLECMEIPFIYEIQ